MAYTVQSDPTPMLPTPPIPDWIRSFRHPHYTNIYELLPDETRLYGTESLFGDWSARLLLLAQDFAPRDFVLDRIRNNDPRPYRHEPDLRTNKHLAKYAADIGVPMLYGSALACLLRNSPGFRGTLRDLNSVMPFARDVLRFTMENMPNLRAIACLGQLAWRTTNEALRTDAGPWREHRESRRAVAVQLDNRRTVQLFALPHPTTFPGGKARVLEDWAVLRDSISGRIPT